MQNLFPEIPQKHVQDKEMLSHVSTLSAKAQYFLKTSDHFPRKLLISDHLIEMCMLYFENLCWLKLKKGFMGFCHKSLHKILKNLENNTRIFVNCSLSFVNEDLVFKCVDWHRQNSHCLFI